MCSTLILLPNKKIKIYVGRYRSALQNSKHSTVHSIQVWVCGSHVTHRIGVTFMNMNMSLVYF